MVKSVQAGKEIAVTVANKIGVLADMSVKLADGGINILAVAGYAEGAEAKIMLVTSDNSRTVDCLQKAGYKSIKESDVILIELEDKPGALKAITSQLAAEAIDINYIYGTTCLTHCPARMVLSTSNNEKALAGLAK